MATEDEVDAAARALIPALDRMAARGVLIGPHHCKVPACTREATRMLRVLYDAGMRTVPVCWTHEKTVREAAHRHNRVYRISGSVVVDARGS